MKKMEKDGNNELENSMTETVSSWPTPSTFYVGCKNWVDTSVEYIIHSVRIHSDELPGMATDFYEAVYNSKF